MQKGKGLYFLQPASDQAISVAAVLQNFSDITINAVILENEKQPAFLDKIYNSLVIVKNYQDLPLNSIVVPFGAQSTEEKLKVSDVQLASITMTQAALKVYEKPSFLKFCEEHRLPTPKTYISEEEIPSTAYPVFFKQKYEQGGGVRGIANTNKELPEEYKENLIYQEFINTPGTYGVGFIAEKGLSVASFCHFEELSYPISGGSAIVIRKNYNKRLVELTEIFIDKSNYSGWGLAEFKWCEKRQDFVFMEVNAKFWASCELAFRNEPAFIKNLFNIEVNKEEIDGMVFVNRAFNSGLSRGIRVLLNNKKLHKVIYPGLLKSIIIGMLPNVAIRIIKTIRKFCDRRG